MQRSWGEGRLLWNKMDPAHPCPSTEPPILEPVEFQSNLVVVRGSSVVLPCEARGSPLPLVSWMKDGEPFLPQSLEQGPGLQLEMVGAGDSGTYSCVAVSEAGEARRHFQLTVMGGSPVLHGLPGWRKRGPGDVGTGSREAGAPGGSEGLVLRGAPCWPRPQGLRGQDV